MVFYCVHKFAGPLAAAVPRHSKDALLLTHSLARVVETISRHASCVNVSSWRKNEDARKGSRISIIQGWRKTSAA